VDVFVRQNDGMLALEVKDNGRGILPRDISHPQSLGLLGMRERVLHLGGTMTVAGAPNVGTTVTVQIPVEPAQT
jgi:signal transduction histidine kinase